VNDHHNDDDVTGWLAAAEVLTATLNEFHRVPLENKVRVVDLQI
jgi:hypothetical protein